MSDEEGREDALEQDCVEPTDGAEEGESFTKDDELQETFSGDPIHRVIADDGLPKPVVEDVLEDAWAPPFLPEQNQICAADTSAFVVRSEKWGGVLAKWKPEDVELTENGLYRAQLSTASDGSLSETFADEHGWVRVKPIREQCEHLLLQLEPPAPSQAHVIKLGWLNRYCTVRRTVAGAFLLMRDDAKKACSMRSPADRRNTELLRMFDEKLAARSRERTYHRMFDVRDEEPKQLEHFEAVSKMIQEEQK